jgi:transcription elongation factor Elf1
MSVFIDRAFLLRISPKLQRFTQKKEDLYNFRCPLCGDSQKNKTKSRGYVYRKKNDYFYMCHNCGASTSFYNFLDKVDPTLIKEYALERYKNGDNNKSNHKTPDFEEFKTEKPIFKKSLVLPSIDSLPEAHFAKVYVQQRRIPEDLSLATILCGRFRSLHTRVWGFRKSSLRKTSASLFRFMTKKRTSLPYRGER